MNKDSGGDNILVVSNPKRWCCESAALNIPANLENSAVATGLEKVNFHSNPKERQYQRMFKLLQDCIHFTCYLSNAQNSQSQASTNVNHELPNVQARFRKGRGTKDQIANIRWIIEKTRVPEKHLFLLYWLCQNFWLCGSQQTVERS